MDKIKRLRKQLAEMRRLGQSQTVIGSKKYQELIAQVYEELKKIKPRLPTVMEWEAAAGVDAGSIMKLRKSRGMEKFPLGYDMEAHMRGRKKAVKTTLAKPTTATLAKGSTIIGVKYRNAADKTKVRNILTKYFSVPINKRDIEGTIKQLRTIKDLKPKTSGSIIQFMGFAGKDLNIKPAVVTEAVALYRPGNVSEHILRSLTEHIRQGGTDFKYAPKGQSTLFSQLKIIDVKNPKEILTKDSIREAIKNNDPRFREYATKWKQLKDLKKTTFTHPLTRETMTLAEALEKGTGVKGALHLDHIRGIKTSPLNDLQIATWKGNMAKKKALTTKGAELFGVKTVAPGGKNIVGPDISFAKRQSDLIKFATDLFKKGGTREVLTPNLHLKNLIDAFNASSNPQKVKTAVQLGCLAAAEGGRIGYALGSGTITCVNQKLTNEPVQSSMRLRATEGIGKVRGAATNFLKLVGRGGVKAAPYAALAAVGAAIEPLVKQFRSDDPSTYLTNENQMKGMLLATIEGETPKVDEEILKWQTPALGAATAAGAIPGARTVYEARRSGVPLDRSIGPLKGVGKTRAALGITGVLGKALGASFSPLAVAATLPLGIAAQRKGGTEWGDIATDPMNWMGPAFAATGAEMATKGMKATGIMAQAIRLGIGPRALMAGSRLLGWPGLAISAGLWGYDKWKNRSIMDEDDDRQGVYRTADE